MPRIDDIIFYDRLSGLGNYASKDGSLSIPAQSIGVGGFTTNSITIPMDREDAISQIQVKLSLESVWRILGGGQNILYKPSWAAAQYTILTSYYFTGSDLILDIITGNATGGTVNVPAFDVTLRAFLYKAPFA